MVPDCAGGRGCARVLVQARVDTSVRDACRVLGAVLVDPALDTDALDVWVTLEAWRTATCRLVVGGVALSIAGTRIVEDAGVETLSVGADFCDFTLAIRATANWHTGNIRIAGESLGTVADRFVVSDEALGIGSTVARIHTVTVVAGFSLWTVVVCLTTNNNHRLGT